uniref:Uncharacterized protein n=1 Tax=Sarcophilus harrisii TaxID=9305 RepID=A0A7N4NQM9_SARHA
MGRRYRLFPKASLVQTPPKDLCYHSKSVLLPCPPHRIAPKWERDPILRSERMNRFSDQLNSIQLPVYHYHRTEPATLPCLKNPATNSVPLPYLNYQVTPKPPPYPCHRSHSVLSLPNPDFRTRSNISLGTPPKDVKPPLHPKYYTESPVVLKRFPKISQGQNYQKEELPHLRQKSPALLFPEHRSEDLSHLKQQPPYLKVSPHREAEELSQPRQKPPASSSIPDYQLEATSPRKTRDYTLPDRQPSARSAPETCSPSAEAAQDNKQQVKILAFVLGGGKTKCLILQSPFKNHHFKTDMVLEKASDLEYLVNETSKQIDLHFRESTSPLPYLNQQSGTWASPSPLPKYVNRSTSTEVSWPQSNDRFTSLDPNQQARGTMKYPQSFIPCAKAASDPSLSLGTWESSGPFQCPEHATEASPGPDYKVKDTNWPPSPSGHKVKTPGPGADHFNEVSPNLSHQGTIPMGPGQRNSASLVWNSQPAAASNSKTQVIVPLFTSACSKLLSKNSLTLEYKSSSQANVGQQHDRPVDPNNPVNPSLCPEKQIQAVWDPDCQTIVILCSDDDAQSLNIFDHQEKEPRTPDNQTNHKFVGSQYQTQTVPDPHKIKPSLSGKTKVIPPLNHNHITESESQTKKTTQPASSLQQAISQLPDYWMALPQTSADSLKETTPDSSAQVIPYQTKADFWNKMLQDPDHQATTLLCQDNSVAPSLGIDHQVITPPCKGKNIETPSLGTDHQVLTLPCQDKTGTLSLGIDHQVITPPCQNENTETPSLVIDHQVITSPCQDENTETPSLGIDHQVITPPCQDENTETPSLGIDHQVITPPCQGDTETPSLGIDHQVTIPPCQDENIEITSLDIDHQMTIPTCQNENIETPSLGIDHQVTIPTCQNENIETPSLGIDHQVITPPGHNDSERSSLDIDHHIVNPPGQDHSEIPSLGIDHQVTTSPCQDDKTETLSLGIDHQMITPSCQDDNSEIPSLGINCQVIIPSCQDDTEILGIDQCIITPPCQNDNETPSLGIDHQVIILSCQNDTEIPSLSIDHQVITPPQQDDCETLSLGTDLQVITPPWQDDSKQSLMELDCKIIMLPRQDYIDHQFIAPPWQDDNETPPLGIDHKLITSSGQDDTKISSLGTDSHIITLSSHDYSKIPFLGKDHQITMSSGLDDRGTSSLGIGYQLTIQPEQDDRGTPSLGIDHQLTTPSQQDDGGTPSLGLDHQPTIRPEQDDRETPSLGIDHQLTTPSQQDDGGTPSFGLDHQPTTQPEQDDRGTPLLGIDHQLTTRPEQDDRRTPSLGMDHQLTTRPEQDDRGTPSLGIDHQLTTPPEQDDRVTLSLGIDHQLTTPPEQDDRGTPSLGLDHQLTTQPEQDDRGTPSLGIDHQFTTQPEQDDRETPSLAIDHQLTTRPEQDDRGTPSLVIDHQLTTPPEQDDRRTPSLGIDHQLTTPPEQDDRETLSLSKNHQLITSPEQDDRRIPSLAIDHQFTTRPEQDDRETPSLGIDHQLTTPPEQDDRGTPSLGIDHQLTTPPEQEDRRTPSLGIDHQLITPPEQDGNRRIPSLAIDHQLTTQPEQDDRGTPSLGIDHQHITRPHQNGGTNISWGIDHEITTLPGSDHLTITTSSPISQILKPSDQITILHDLNCEANMLMKPEYKNTTLLGYNKQVEIGPDTNNSQSILPTGKDDQVIVSLPPQKKTFSLSNVTHQKDIPIGYGHHQTIAPSTSDFRDQAQSGFQHQTVKKKEIPWRLKYIKPYIIQGRGNVSARTVHAIINSIPEEKIKRDICKQILFRQMKETPPQRPGECMSISYSICLECASWVPDGCLHDKGKKNQFEAEMLAIPMPLPGSDEEMGLKFVLKVPYNSFAFFTQVFPELNVQWPSYYSPYFPSFSHKQSVNYMPAEDKWLDNSKTDSYPQKIKTSENQQPVTEENLPQRRDGNEKSRGHDKGFKSLLEKFQRQRQN